MRKQSGKAPTAGQGQGSGGIRFIDVVKPFLRFLPEIEEPRRKIQFREKAVWTFSCLFIFLLFGQIPLFGIERGLKNDPFQSMRAVMASHTGTLMELGITPIVTASMSLHMLNGMNIINVDANNTDKKLFDAVTKLVGMVIVVLQAAAYVLSGMYGAPAILGISNVVLLIAQLSLAGIIVVLLDEVMAKGHGISVGGISLFIAVETCTNIVWSAFSFSTVMTPRGPEYEGALIALLNFIYSKPDKIMALREAFYRAGAPNVTSLISTVLIFLMVIYFQGFRVDITVKHQRMRSHSSNYPIKLFYTQNMPIILHAALISNFFFFSQMMYRSARGNMLVNIIGQWQEIEFTGHAMPVGGIAYYVSSPSSLLDLLFDPIHSVIYILFTLASCAYFSATWINVSGEAPKDVARKLKQQELVVMGHRDVNTEKMLGRYIIPASRLGGAAIGALTIIADFLGAIGSGTGILLAVTIIYKVYEEFYREQQQLMMQAMQQQYGQ